MLAALTGTAQAQTSVTLYGIVDIGVGYQRISMPKSLVPGSGMVDAVTGAVTPATGKVDYSKVGLLSGVNSGSRWGLRGTEDLGGGLSAVFVLESGFDATNGMSSQGHRLFGRQATLGLNSSEWGRLEFGRQTNVASKYIGSIDPMGNGFGQAAIGTTFGAANTVRYDNMAMYQTPVMSGFQMGIGYSFSTDTTETRELADGSVVARNGWATDYNTRAFTTGLRYSEGPMQAALTYDKRKPGKGAGWTGSAPTSWMMAGSYDFDVVRLALAYGQARNGWFGGGGISAFSKSSDAPGMPGNYTQINGFKTNSYMVGLSMPMGATSNLFTTWQYGSVDGKSKSMTLENMQVYSLGYTYDFSKRTNLYAIGSYATNYGFQQDVKSTLLAIGLRHRF